jgi:uncharacterized coiled-coil DUF342 family protein
LIEQQKTSEIEAVNQQLATIREQLNNTHTNISKHIEKRDKLNEQAKTLRQEVTELKKERDRLNESVKTLKLQRDEMRAKMAPFIEEIKTYSQKIRDLKEKRSGENRNDLKKQFDALEFKIATTSLDLHEEKRLIDQVKQIEILLSVYKKMDVQSKKITQIKSELKVFQDKADAYHQELTENAKKSQEIHSAMLGKFVEMNKIREEATNLHVLFLQAKEQIKLMHEEISSLMIQRQKLFEQRQIERQKQFEERQKSFETAREENEKLKKAKQNEIKEKLGSQVREKLQRGERLNWQEFQLLAGDESETQD